jgi:hypothetical protein
MYIENGWSLFQIFSALGIPISIYLYIPISRWTNFSTYYLGIVQLRPLKTQIL